MFSSRSAALLVVSGWLLHAAPASAQDAEADARKAFAAGQAAEQNGDPRAACDHYRTSLASLRAPGTLERVARCEALEGRYVVAIRAVDEALGLLTADNLEDQAAYRALRTTWESKLARLVIRSRAGATIGALTIDGTPHAVDTPLALDPGQHVVVVDGQSKTLSLVSGDNPPLELPLELPVAKPAPGGAPAGPRPQAESESSGLTGWQTAAVVSFAVGGLAFAGAAVTGVMALDADSTAESTCASAPGATCQTAVDDAKALLVPNLAMWIVGGVGATAGVTFLLVDASRSPSRAPEALRVRIGPAAVQVAGSF